MATPETPLSEAESRHRMHQGTGTRPAQGACGSRSGGRTIVLPNLDRNGGRHGSDHALERVQVAHLAPVDLGVLYQILREG